MQARSRVASEVKDYGIVIKDGRRSSRHNSIVSQTLDAAGEEDWKLGKNHAICCDSLPAAINCARTLSSGIQITETQAGFSWSVGVLQGKRQVRQTDSVFQPFLLSHF